MRESYTGHYVQSYTVKKKTVALSLYCINVSLETEEIKMAGCSNKCILFVLVHCSLLRALLPISSLTN
jgi:hypothetical protein